MPVPPAPEQPVEAPVVPKMPVPPQEVAPLKMPVPPKIPTPPKTPPPKTPPFQLTGKHPDILTYFQKGEVVATRRVKWWPKKDATLPVNYYPLTIWVERCLHGKVDFSEERMALLSQLVQASQSILKHPKESWGGVNVLQDLWHRIPDAYFGYPGKTSFWLTLFQQVSDPISQLLKCTMPSSTCAKRLKTLMFSGPLAWTPEILKLKNGVYFRRNLLTCFLERTDWTDQDDTVWEEVVRPILDTHSQINSHLIQMVLTGQWEEYQKMKEPRTPRQLRQLRFHRICLYWKTLRVQYPQSHNILKVPIFQTALNARAWDLLALWAEYHFFDGSKLTSQFPRLVKENDFDQIKLLLQMGASPEEVGPKKQDLFAYTEEHGSPELLSDLFTMVAIEV